MMTRFWLTQLLICGFLVVPSWAWLLLNNGVRTASKLYADLPKQTSPDPSRSLRAKNNDDGSFGWTDDTFQEWMLAELKEEAPQLCKDYADVMVKASRCITQWRRRYRGDAVLWKRLFKKERVVKEVIEAIPIIHAVECWMEQQNEDVTIFDLCSGKGYLSMLLSEYLTTENVKKCILIDKAWPRCHGEPKPHHMNWDHIYANNTDGDSYFTTWPIALHTSKQNLKQPSTLRDFQKRFKKKGPILILAVHLCGTLSIQAVKLFHQLPEVHCMILKPCCLPGMAHTKEKDNFVVGKYSFSTKEVCAPGKFFRKEWNGPPRWQLQGKFDRWCYHLHEALSHEPDITSRLVSVPVQSKGGYQNTFLFAEKQPTTYSLWDRGVPSIEESKTISYEKGPGLTKEE